MTAAQFEQAAGIGLLGSQTGKAVDRLTALFAGHDFGDVALDGKDLRGVREIKIVRELGAAPDRAPLQTAMSFIGGGVLRGEEL